MDLYFHEDDFCQIELIPSENEAYVKKEIENISTFAEEHRAEGGVGWTDMYMRDGSKQKTLKDYKMHYRDFANVLPETAVKADKVFTGYSSYREECKFTIGWELKNAHLFLSYTGSFVTHIWFDYDETGAAEDLYALLTAIADKYDLLFIDWSRGFYSRIRTDAELKNKLTEYAG